MENSTEVTSVKAISDLKVAKGTATDLKFLVNGKEELTKAEFEKKYEGYKVSFLFNKTTADGDTFDKATGKVTVSKAETFKYAVQVEDAEGNKLPETVVAKDFVDVKVVDAAKVTKVHELGLVSGEKAWENPTVTQADQVKIVATVFENGLGTKTTDKNEEDKATEEAKALAVYTPKIAKVTSSNPTVAFYDAKGIQVRKDGKVTFTVEFEDKDIEALQTTVEVTTVAKQTATSIKAEDLKVKAGEETTVKFDVLDQNGEKLRTDANVFVAVKPEGKKEAEATGLNVTAGAATTNLTFEKGNNVVTVYGADEKGTAADKEVVLGTFKVEAVDVSDEAKIEEYKLVNNNKDEDGNVKPLDLNIDTEVNNTELTLDVEAYIKDIKVGLKEGVTLVAKSSDAKVVALTGADKDGYVSVTKDDAEVKATAQAAGKSVITLYTKEGDLLTPVDTFEVTVNDTTKAITELPFKEGVKHVTVKDSATTPEALKVAVIAAVDEKVKLTDAKIVKVEPVKANGIVIVTMAKEYGGKEIVLPALFTSLEGVTTNAEENTESINETEEVYKDAVTVEAATDAKYSVTIEEQEYSGKTFDELKLALEADKFTVTGDATALVVKNETDEEVYTGEVTVKPASEANYSVKVEGKDYSGKTFDELKLALEADKFTVTGDATALVVTKTEKTGEKVTHTQTVTFTFSDNVTLADDASFELKDADGKVIATEAKAEANAKTVTIKIITEDKASPTVATATLEGATVKNALQVIKEEKVTSN